MSTGSGIARFFENVWVLDSGKARL